jgi:hypothetical protein
VGVVVSSPVLAALPSRNGLEVIWTRSI